MPRGAGREAEDMNTNHETCTIGGCNRPVTRRVEIRRRATDEHPAEVRPICSGSHCEMIARQSAAGFDVRVAS